MNYFVRLDVFGPKPTVLWLGPGGRWVHDLGGAVAFTSRKKAEDIAGPRIAGYIQAMKAKVEASVVRISTPHRVAVDAGWVTAEFRPFAKVIEDANKL